MAKKIKANVKLQIAAGIANPSPPVGPALGQHGVNIIEFCKMFNEKTKNLEQGIPIPVMITVYTDRSFTFILKTPPAAVLLKKIAGIQRGSSNSKKEKVGKLSMNQINEIAKIKYLDMTGSNISSICRSLIGTAHSLGLEVEDK